MGYPVGDGTKETFLRKWYIAQNFGIKVGKVIHAGPDINDKRGGFSDFRSPLLAVANGRIVYINNMHPHTGFGLNFALRIETPVGPRWVQYAHCDYENFPTEERDVLEGEVIALIGNTGNSTASHLHFEIRIDDPGSARGLDRVPYTMAELNAGWEDPLPFIDKWLMQPENELIITDETYIPQIGKKVGEIRMELIDLNNKIAQIRTIVE